MGHCYYYVSMSFVNSKEEGYWPLSQGCRLQKMKMASKRYDLILKEQKRGLFSDALYHVSEALEPLSLSLRYRGIST